jgi:hypothetical protein
LTGWDSTREKDRIGEVRRGEGIRRDELRERREERTREEGTCRI